MRLYSLLFVSQVYLGNQACASDAVNVGQQPEDHRLAKDFDHAHAIVPEHRFSSFPIHDNDTKTANGSYTQVCKQLAA